MGYRQNMLAAYLGGQTERPNDYRNMYAANALLDDLAAAAGREDEKVLEETLAEFLADVRLAETFRPTE